jgi:hypothetical protein
MIILDENLPENQAARLRDWGIRFRVVGIEVARLGTKDDSLIPVLHRLSRPTFFTLDGDFCAPRFRHRHYCLVWLDLLSKFAAVHIRRFLKHPAFDTHAKRMGVVARVHPTGIQCWRLHENRQHFETWPDE